MPRPYSNRTLVKLVAVMDPAFSHSGLDKLFFGTSIPDEFQHGGSKEQRCIDVVRGLTESEDEAHHGLLVELMKEVVLQRQVLFEESPPRGNISQLIRSLKADGFDVVGGQLVPIDEQIIDIPQEISILETRLQVLNMPDVQRNLDQAHQNYVDGNLEACNAMLRTALEATLKNAAEKLAGGLQNIPMNNPKHGHMPADIRRYLENSGFFENDESELVRYYYGYASRDGSHPGMSSTSESRLRRLMTIALIQYTLEKLEVRFP